MNMHSRPLPLGAACCLAFDNASGKSFQIVHQAVGAGNGGRFIPGRDTLSQLQMSKCAFKDIAFMLVGIPKTSALHDQRRDAFDC